MDDAVSVDKHLPPRDTQSMQSEIDELKAQQAYLEELQVLLALHEEETKLAEMMAAMAVDDPPTAPAPKDRCSSNELARSNLGLVL